MSRDNAVIIPKAVDERMVDENSLTVLEVSIAWLDIPNYGSNSKVRTMERKMDMHSTWNG